MSDLQETADFILKAATNLERTTKLPRAIAADPNGAPRVAIRNIYPKFRKVLANHFNDFLQGTGLSDDEYEKITKSITNIIVKVQASKLKNGYKVIIVIGADPNKTFKGKDPNKDKILHMRAAAKIGKYLNSKEGVNMSKAASISASKHAGPDTSSFSVSRDVLFTAP